MTYDRDIDIVHTIFISDILQLCGNFACELRDVVKDDQADSSEWLKSKVFDMAHDFAKRASRIQSDASANFKEALAARQKQREQEGGQS